MEYIDASEGTKFAPAKSYKDISVLDLCKQQKHAYEVLKEAAAGLKESNVLPANIISAAHTVIMEVFANYLKESGKSDFELSNLSQMSGGIMETLVQGMRRFNMDPEAFIEDMYDEAKAAKVDEKLRELHDVKKAFGV